MDRVYILCGKVLLVSILLLSCDKNLASDCNVSDPVEELAWLKSEIDATNKDDEYGRFTYYEIARYKGNTVFIYYNCHPAINYSPSVRDCNGELIGYFFDISQEDLKRRSIIWKHAENACGI